MTPAPSAAHSHLEALEPRLAPAGIVTVSLSPQGHLILTGDSADNAVTLMGEADGTWILNDPSSSGTLFNYQSLNYTSLNFTSPLHSIQADLKAGEDYLNLAALNLLGSLTIQDTSGGNSISLSNNTLHGPVKITTGAGEDFIEITDNHIAGHLTIHTGHGTDMVELGSGIYNDVNVHLSTAETREQDNIHLLGLRATTILGDFSIQTSGPGDSDIALSPATHLTIRGDLSIRTGIGYTAVQIATYTHTQTVHIGGDLTYHGGSGDDELYIGQGNPDNLTNFTVSGTTTLLAGGGQNNFLFDVAGSLILEDLHFHTGTDISSLVIQAKDLHLDSLDILGSRSHTSSVTLTADTLIITDDITVKNAAKHNPQLELETGFSLNITTNQLHVGGDITIINKNTSNYISLTTHTGSIGSLTFQGSKHTDSVQLTGQQALHSHGDISLNFGKGLSSNAGLSHLHIHGDLKVTSSSSATHLGPGERALDSLAITDSTLHGKTTITQKGLSDGTVLIRDSSFLSQLNINTGTGNDTLHFGLLSLEQPTTYNNFHAPVRIQLGSGDDLLNLDSRAGWVQDFNTFHSTLHVNGGPGNNTFRYSPADDIFATPPTFKKLHIFEQHLPLP